MKQGFARQGGRHRNHTPNVIHLPPPKPPVAARREPAPLDAEPAPEPAMIERTELRTTQLPTNRQARRKALRAEAKAMRRLGAPVEAAPADQVVEQPAGEETLTLAVEAATTEPLIERAAATAEAIIQPAEVEQPLPPARALVVAGPRGLAVFAHRLRRLFGLGNRIDKPADGAIVTQLHALRDDLARLQHAIDRALEGARV